MSGDPTAGASDPIDRVAAAERLSLRAVLVHEFEDPTAALAAAGILDDIAIPVVLGEELDPSVGMLGDGRTPNLIAVLETEDQDEDVFDSPASTQPGSVRLAGEATPPAAAVTTTLPAAYGMQPLAPVRKLG